MNLDCGENDYEHCHKTDKSAAFMQNFSKMRKIARPRNPVGTERPGLIGDSYGRQIHVCQVCAQEVKRESVVHTAVGVFARCPQEVKLYSRVHSVTIQ